MLGLLAEPGCPLAVPSGAARSLHRSSSPSPGSRSPGSVTLRVWELPRPGIEPVSPALTGRFLSTESLGKSSCSLLKVWLEHIRTSLIAQLVKNLPARQETPVRFLSRNNPLEEGKAAHPSILAPGNSMDCIVPEVAESVATFTVSTSLRLASVLPDLSPEGDDACLTHKGWTR